MENTNTSGTPSHDESTLVGHRHAPAGWQPDPDHPATLRYWDGSAWTEHRSAPAAVSASAPVASTPPVDRSKRRAVMILIGGALMSVGALLPWETQSVFGSTLRNIKGTEAGAGGILLALGGVIALLAFLFMNGTLKRKVSTATLTLSITGLVLAFLNFSSITDQVDEANGASSGGAIETAVGVGILITLAGCALAAVASFLLLRQKDVASS